MKSSALSFIVLFPLLALLLLLTQQTVVNALRPDRMSATSEALELEKTTGTRGHRRATSTTTQKPPSLRAPRLMRTPRPTTVMTHATTRAPGTTTTTTTTTTLKPAVLHTRRQSTVTAHRLAPRAKAENVTTAPVIRQTRTSRRNVPTNVREQRSTEKSIPTDVRDAGIVNRGTRKNVRQTRTVDISSQENVRPNRSYLSGGAIPTNYKSNDDEASAVSSKGVVESKAYNQIDNKQIKSVSQNNRDNNNNNDYSNSNNEDTKHAITVNIARTSAIMAPVTPPSTASLSPSVKLDTAAIVNSHDHASVVAHSSTIDTTPSYAMTNHQNQPLLQRQSKQISAFSARTSAQRVKALNQRDINSGIGDDNGGGIVHSARHPQTPKTPRMIHRLVAGHIQNAEDSSTYQISAVTKNSTVSNSTTTHKPTTHYVRTKGGRSSYRSVKVSTTTATPMNNAATTTTTTTAKPFLLSRNREDLSEDGTDEHNDDEALLEDEGDFDNWDNGILRLSAGSGKENALKSKKSKEESKKTLSDQVRDGKYGLIEKELFRRPPKRPGVLSYLPNKETPIDNKRTYGGLNEEDIWLAEDHLLVIKGGSLNKGEADEPWPPIDDYDAPGRQIKLPPNPKVPPPFPVQLEENGPLQFIGNNKFTVVYPVANESLSVYPIGPETNYASPESDSDNEKNLITRPGSAQDTAQGEPGYLYPAPYPAWLYHNQTFVNPFLSNARPITFPNLGPFPLGRSNGSLENANVTDDFDEDDPSLYYPPAYSFVYKNNYTNPVPPGPLVPGIVLPPPPNQFTRLEKTEKIHSPPVRHRGYGTTSTSTSTTSSTTTTTTSTTTTSSTTETPYRPKVITKIHHYQPKTIIITPEPPAAISHVVPQSQLPPLSPAAPTPTVSSSPIIEPIPVPVAVHIPIFPSNKYPKARPNSGAYDGTAPQNHEDTLSKSNPIYYEYFEAKRQPSHVTSNVIDDFLATTDKPVYAKPIKLYATSKRPFKSQQQNQRPYRPTNSQVQPQRQYLPQDVVYITPKPEQVRYKQVLPVPVETPIYHKPRPLENFEQEENAIRETLRYYQNQQLRDNNIPRTPKAKPIYEFSFDASKNLESEQPTAGADDFQPPTEYDETPFKPMVTYSPPVDDENSFHAIAVEKADAQRHQQQQKQEQREEEEYAQPQQQPRRYQTTTTLVPVQPDTPYRQQAAPPPPITHTRPKKVRAKYLQPAPLYAEYRSGAQELPQYPSTPRTLVATQTPWVTVNQGQELNEYDAPPLAPGSQQLQAPPQYQRIERPPIVIAPKQRNFNGYYYGGPQLHARQNNRFYEEPFQQPINARRIVKYRQQQRLPPLQPPQSNYQQQQQPPQSNYQQQQQQQQTLWSLENDTYVNYAPNRPPLNPDAEYINPYPPALPLNPYGAQQLQRYNSPQPPLSHQSQYYAPPLPHQQQQQQLAPQRQYPQPIPLHRDILVNYRQPLQPINPDSEYISHPQVVRPQLYTPIYPPNAYQRLPPQLTQTGEQDGLYYIAPKYRRSNNNNDDDNNNKSDESISKNENDINSDGSQNSGEETANVNSNTPNRGGNSRDGSDASIKNGLK
ncbi:uncharacterized protein [Eurosta solidaginis]|uniref:uncharacterized protein n=1 Tax=Eurosta solidaginis TaxID=178769 RepID=UPI00353140A3